MAAPRTNTIHEKLISDINNRAKLGLPIAKSEVFWLNGLKLDAKKMMNINPALAHIALAAIAQLECDADKALHHLNCANTIRPDKFIRSQQIIVLTNLGFFSDTLKLLDEALSPKDGLFTEYFTTFISIGAFQKLNDFQKEAVLMGIDLTGLPTETASKASFIMKSASISDERAAEALSVAGTMLRERKIVTLGEAEFSIDDDFDHSPTVFLTFPIRVKADVAADMTWDLYEKLLQKFPDYSPALNIGFRSAVLP